MDRRSRRDASWTRRQVMRMAAAGVAGISASGWMQALAASADPGRKMSCILLWMTGGPSQVDTFDPKPEHENGGPFKAIETAVPGIRLAEHLPGLAREAKDLAIIRSMSTGEGDHGRATYLLRTGYLPQGQVRFPTLGSIVANEFDDASDLPRFVSIAPYRAFNPSAFGSGFLGPRFAPLIVGERTAIDDGNEPPSSFKVDDIEPPHGVDRARADDRLALMDTLAGRFLSTRPGIATASHEDAYKRAVRMMRSSASSAFDLDDEPEPLRDAYGRNPFGQGCLLARRLVERGVPFVEVSLSGVDGSSSFAWDTHQENFQAVERLSGVLDAGWSTLMADLRDRGRLDSTMIVWMGEFGRTPRINEQAGRDHFPNAWSTVLAGGGIRGGQVVGDTGPDGMEVKDRPVSVPDLLATIIKGLGLDPAKQNVGLSERPIRLVDLSARPIEEILA